MTKCFYFRDAKTHRLSSNGSAMMLELRHFPISLSPALVVFLSFISIGGVLAITGEAEVLPGVFIILGLILGGLAWIVDALFSLRWSLTRQRLVDRDPAVEALRERYARGELDENQFEERLRHLKEA